jgi:hypothetical protein
VCARRISRWVVVATLVQLGFNVPIQYLQMLRKHRLANEKGKQKPMSCCFYRGSSLKKRKLQTPFLSLFILVKKTERRFTALDASPGGRNQIL